MPALALAGLVIVGLLVLAGCDPSALFGQRQAPQPPTIINNVPSGGDSGVMVLVAVVVVLLVVGVTASVMWGIKQMKQAHAKDVTLKVIQAHPEYARGLTFINGEPVLPTHRTAFVNDNQPSRMLER